MALDRLILQAGTALNVSGSIQEELTGLWNRTAIQLSSIGGTGDAITATLVPALTGGTLVTGMKFSFIAAANNTGATTISLNGGAAVSIRSPDGNPLTSGQIVSGRLYGLEAVAGGTLRLSGIAATGGYNKRVFLTSGIWTKPDGLVKVRVRSRGAGGGGGAKPSGGGSADKVGAGGGGGGESIVEKLAADLAATEAVTVGAGGTAGANANSTPGGTGGTSSFGTHAVATGGVGGISANNVGFVANPGGVGGVGTAGDMLSRGILGGPTHDFAGSAPHIGGDGGASPTGGGGGLMPTTTGVANNGLANSGGGGSGGRHTGTNGQIGGVGGSGYVEIEEFF